MPQVTLNKETLNRGELTLYDVTDNGTKKGVIFTAPADGRFAGRRSRDHSFCYGLSRQQALDYVCG